MTSHDRPARPVRLPAVAAGLTRQAAGLSRYASSVAAQFARAAGLTRRGVWSRPGRHHIEVHGVCQPGGERLARQVERALERMPGVAWARVNAPSGRVVVSVQPPEPPLRDLISTVARVERTSDHEPDTDVPDPQPPEEGPRTKRAIGTIAADALGLTLSVANRILPFTPVPGEVAGLLTAVDLHPKLHALAGRGLRNNHRADTIFPLAEAVVQGLSGGWPSILLDGLQRGVQWQEARAQLGAWTRAEPRLTGTPEKAAADPPECGRPQPKPDGPAERYASRSIALGAAAAAAAAPVSGASAPPRSVWPHCRRRRPPRGRGTRPTSAWCSPGGAWSRWTAARCGNWTASTRCCWTGGCCGPSGVR